MSVPIWFVTPEQKYRKETIWYMKTRKPKKTNEYVSYTETMSGYTSFKQRLLVTVTTYSTTEDDLVLDVKAFLNGTPLKYPCCVPIYNSHGQQVSHFEWKGPPLQ